MRQPTRLSIGSHLWIKVATVTVIVLLLTNGSGQPAARGQAASQPKAKQASHPELAISRYGKNPYWISPGGALMPLDYNAVMSKVYVFSWTPELFQTGYDQSTLYCGVWVPMNGNQGGAGLIEAYHLSPHARFHYLGRYAESIGPDHPVALASGEKGKFLYVLTERGNPPVHSCTLSGFRVDRTGAIFSLRGGRRFVGKTTGRDPEVVSDPGGHFLYVSDIQTHTLSGYRITASGSLAVLSAKPLLLPQTPSHLLFHPLGHFLYVTSADSNVLMKVPISANGMMQLPQVMPLGAVARREPILAMTPDGRFLYAIDYGTSRTAQFRILPNGSLQPLSPASVSAYPYAIHVDLTSRFAYLSEKPPQGNNQIRQYKIGPNGALLPLKVAVIAAPSRNPVFLTFLRPR